jgi:hypothetical protein
VSKEIKESEEVPSKQANPLDEGLAFVAKTLTSPETVSEQSRLGRQSQEFTVDAAAMIAVEAFCHGLVPPLKATGKPLRRRHKVFEKFIHGVFENSQSIMGHGFDMLVEHFGPSFVRMPPMPPGSQPFPGAEVKDLD